jgi:ADP-ribose pyrophosphatase YjhB (NUDIX family)
VGVPNVTRPCAFVFIRAGDRVLVSEMLDELDGPFYRPPGGGIEFGETSADAARRELREEFGIDVSALTLLGVLENIFEERGTRFHEICFIYETIVAAELLERLDGVTVLDLPDGEVEVARVRSLAEIRAPAAPLYPDGVKALLP